MNNLLNYHVLPGGVLTGQARVPGDKSISHRAVIFAAIAEGITEVTGFLEGADCLATLQAFQDMGVKVERPSAEKLVIHGVGLEGLKAPKKILDLGNSGTSIRLLTGLLAGQKFSSQLTGDSSLQRRPMARVVDPLREMGAKIDLQTNGCPPLKIHGNQQLHGIEYAMPIASAQVKSSLLLAGLYAEGLTTIIEPAPSRDHTERMLKIFMANGVRHQATVSDTKKRCQTPKEMVSDTRHGTVSDTERQNMVSDTTPAGRIQIQGGTKLIGTKIVVPTDISSAAFFMVGASIAPGSDIILEAVGINPTRTGVITILRNMSADIQLLNERMLGAEPVADIQVRSAPLKGIKIPRELVPLAIDEFPIIFIAAACAQGETVLQGAEELRVKESDRIKTMVEGLQVLGVNATATADGAIIQGGKLTGGRINSHGDHRIAMSFAIAALRCQQKIVVEDCQNVATSFPNFEDLAKQLGLDITAQ